MTPARVSVWSHNLWVSRLKWALNSHNPSRMRSKYFIVGLIILGPSMPPPVEIKVRSVIVRVGLTLTVTVSTFISAGGGSNYVTGRVRVQESFYPDNSPPFSCPHHTSSWSPERASITQRFLMAKSTGGIPAITVTAASNMVHQIRMASFLTTGLTKRWMRLDSSIARAHTI